MSGAIRGAAVVGAALALWFVSVSALVALTPSPATPPARPGVLPTANGLTVTLTASPTVTPTDATPSWTPEFTPRPSPWWTPDATVEPGVCPTELAGAWATLTWERERRSHCELYAMPTIEALRTQVAAARGTADANATAAVRNLEGWLMCLRYREPTATPTPLPTHRAALPLVLDRR